MATVFISYRRETAAGEARALFNDLIARWGKESVFMDVDSIALGRDFRSALQNILRSCDLMLVIIDKDWAGIEDEGGRNRLADPGDYVRIEVETALKRDIAVAPVLVKGAHMPAAEKLPAEIRELVYRQGFEIAHSRWESDVQEMIRRLGLDLPEEGRPIEPPKEVAGAIGQGKSNAWVFRAGAGQSALFITALMLLLLGVGVYAFLRGLYVAPEVKTPYWTSWMDQAEYQQEFSKQSKNGWYPNQIEAKLIENVVKYRGHFELYPSINFQFYSRHSLNDDEFSAADAEYIQKGFKRVYQQRIMVGSRAFNQGTWTKP
jgi:TIR domain